MPELQVSGTGRTSKNSTPAGECASVSMSTPIHTHEIKTVSVPMSPPQPRVPLGVAIISILMLITGIIYLIIGLAVIGLFALPGCLRGIVMPGSTAGGCLLGSIILMIGFFYIAIVKGLWNLEGWAWITTVVLQIINIVLAIFAGALGQMIIPGIILLYMVIKKDIFI